MMTKTMKKKTVKDTKIHETRRGSAGNTGKMKDKTKESNERGNEKADTLKIRLPEPNLRTHTNEKRVSY